MKNRSKLLLIHTSLFVTVLWLFYADAIMLWMGQIPGGGDDGLKNFFTLAYHIQHSSSFFWFEGMNHPFGEYLSFTDNQPLIAIVLKFANLFLPVSENLHLIHPVLIIVGFAWGSWLLALIFLRLKMPAWLAIFAAVGIIFLSPQWIRLSGHYSLAYGFIIPATIYALQRWNDDEKKMCWLLLGIPLLSGFLHPYFTLMTAGFIFWFLLLRQLINGKWKNIHEWLQTILIPLLPLLIFQLFLWLTDPVSDRPDAPFGYMVYRATMPSVFLPMYTGFTQYVIGHIETWNLPAAEGSFYIGIVAITASLIGLGWIISQGKRSFRPEFVGLLLLASLPLLLLAIGFPFIIEPFDDSLDFMGPLRQFRGIGRFSFVFFYAVNIFGFFMLWQIIQNARIRQVVVIIALVILYSESFYYSKHISALTSEGSSAMVHNDSPLFRANEFDALLPLPYYHIGSENFRTETNLPIIPFSMALSQQNGIPLISVQLSRTSLSQTIANLTLVQEQLHPNLHAASLKDEHWLLVVDNRTELPDHQKRMIAHAEKIKVFDHFECYAFSPKSYKDLYTENVINWQLRKKLALVVSDTLSPSIVYYSFDEKPSIVQFKGRGAKQIKRNDWTHMIPKNHALGKKEKHELSFWIRLDQNAVNTQLWFWEKKNDEDVVFNVSEVGDHITATSEGWGLFSFEFQPEENESVFEILLHREDAPLKIWVDEVLLRPLSLDIKTADATNLNNRYYKPINDLGVLKAEK